MTSDLLGPVLRRLRADAPAVATNGWFCQQVLMALASLSCRDDELIDGLASILVGMIEEDPEEPPPAVSQLRRLQKQGRGKKSGPQYQQNREWQRRDRGRHGSSAVAGPALDWSVHDATICSNALAMLGCGNRADLAAFLVRMFLREAAQLGPALSAREGCYLGIQVARAAAILGVEAPALWRRLLPLAGSCEAARLSSNSLAQLQQTVMWLQVGVPCVVMGTGTSKPRHHPLLLACPCCV
jgi:hypothetical protein